MLVAGVGTGLLNVTFFPPSPEALNVLILFSSDSLASPDASKSLACSCTDSGREKLGFSSLVERGVGERRGVVTGVSEGVFINEVGRFRVVFVFVLWAWLFSLSPEVDDEGLEGGGVALPRNREKSDFIVCFACKDRSEVVVM